MDIEYWDAIAETYGADVAQGMLGDRPRPTKPAAPEWPEIGEHCETTWGQKQNWFECVVLPYEFLALFKYGEWSIMKISDFSNHEFRPMRTAEQREREATVRSAAHAIEMKNGSPITLYIKYCEDLYDAGLLRKGAEK